MASAPAYIRYVSAVYADKYFPEKNATVPFKWEAMPGKPKDEKIDAYGRVDNTDQIYKGIQCQLISGMESDTAKKQDDLVQSSPTPVSIYPLRPPPCRLNSPKFCFRVEDVLQPDGSKFSGGGGGKDNNDGEHCHFRSAYSRSFPWSALRFLSLRGKNAIVPIHKSSYFVLEKPKTPKICGNGNKDQRSHIPSADCPGLKLVQARSQSFTYAGGHVRSCRQASSRPVTTRLPAGERRCNSFNSLLEPRHTIFEDEEGEGLEGEDTETDVAAAATAAAMWAGACILAAAVATEGHHHDGQPCKVASKLRDLMQQSANFSELALYAEGGRIAVGHGGAKRRTKSVDNETTEDFLMEGKTKSCIEYDLDAGHRCLQQERTLAPDCTVETSVENHEQHVQQERTHKSIKQVAKKKPGFFSVLSNFCIACLCPSSAF